MLRHTDYLLCETCSKEIYCSYMYQKASMHTDQYGWLKDELDNNTVHPEQQGNDLGLEIKSKR